MLDFRPLLWTNAPLHTGWPPPPPPYVNKYRGMYSKVGYANPKMQYLGVIVLFYNS
jgi:hypothetical protein